MFKKSIIFLFFSLLLVACGEEFDADFSREVQDFNFTNQEGESFSKDQLDGKIWVSNMIFTNCNTICPALTANMGRLQKLLDEEGVEAELVSFTVDPENDSPEVLKEFVKNHGGEFDNWNALTGYEFEEIQSLAMDSFGAPVEKIEGSDQFLHVNRFFLVDSEGIMVKRYDGEQAEKMKEIVEDIKLLQ